jgi:hypothetical protein
MACQCPNRSTFIARPFHTTSNFLNRLKTSRHSVANANIRWLLGYFLKITFFFTSRFRTIIESVSMANDKVFKSVPYASSQATTSSNRFANAGIPA